MCLIMGGGNANMWHDHMYVHCTILKSLSHAITMQFFKKSNMVDQGCMYGVYKLSYRIPIFNSLATIIQLTDFHN
jgi:hypothetical protein